MADAASGIADEAEHVGRKRVEPRDLAVHAVGPAHQPLHVLVQRFHLAALPLFDCRFMARDRRRLIGPGPVDLQRFAERIDRMDPARRDRAEILAGAGVEASTTRLLLRTRNSRHWAQGDTEFDTAFVGISADGAAWLVEHGIRLVGIDYLSVAPYHQSVPTHRTLLEAGMVILEGADLSTVESGIYQLYCLPLKLVGSDGAPARAILIA